MKPLRKLFTTEDAKRLAEQEKAREVVYEKFGKRIHPGDADLVIAASKAHQPKRWDLFSIGEFVEISDSLFEVRSVDKKDINLVASDSYDFSVGSIVAIGDHKFRVRKTDSSFVVLRPLVGTARNYLLSTEEQV
jgi:hypothetical protein